MRNDGLWTLARVVDYESGGGTYGVELQDGRRKYFVQEDHLRIPAMFLLTTGNI